jgi:hypothetical protein
MNFLRSLLPIPVEVARIFSTGPSTWTTTEKQRAEAGPITPHICSNPRCAVTKVFQTIELLEHILTYLPTSDILPLQLVNKTWKDLMLQSPSLRTHLFVHSRWLHPASDFQLLSLNIPGLEIKRVSPVRLGHWVELRMNLTAARFIKTQQRWRRADHPPGAFCHNRFFERCDCEREIAGSEHALALLCPLHVDLLISQPPVKSMQMFFVDADADTSATKFEKWHEPSNTEDEWPWGTGLQPLSKISCDAGITLGFAADLAMDAEDENDVLILRAIISYCVQSDAAPRKRLTTRRVTRID